ncbi:MAG: ATP-binding protein, partial [Chitinophagaceae bacterium]
MEQTGVILYDEAGHIQGLQCMVKDIDEKKRIQIQLEESEYRRKENQFRLESILTNANSLIFMKDLQGRYLLINRKFETTLNISPSEILGKTDYDFSKEEDADRYSEADQKVIKSQKPYRTEEILYHPDGEHHYLIIKFPLFNNENEIYGLCGIATDISDRVHYEQELLKARKIAENAEKLQEQFLANMSHDIRTPLNGIIGMADLLHTTDLNKEQREFSDAIMQSADTLLVLINDILDLSKIKAGMLNIESIQFRLSDLISRTIYPLKQKAIDKGLRFHSFIDPDIPEVLKGDPYRLSQILLNLIGNAVKFTNSGEISLSAERQTSNEEYIRVSFSVKDTGIGIPLDKIDTIFENFTQSSSDTTRKYGGTGLGLAIVKQLINLQGGDIHVESEVNKGSRFYLTISYLLPADNEGQLPTKNQDEKLLTPGALKGYRILVAEDDAVNQKMIGITLRKAGVETDIAGNGREMINYLTSGNHYDLILSDIHMPEMDGYEAAGFIRNNLKLNIPILAMTATVLENEKEN